MAIDVHAGNDWDSAYQCVTNSLFVQWCEGRAKVSRMIEELRPVVVVRGDNWAIAPNPNRPGSWDQIAAVRNEAARVALLDLRIDSGRGNRRLALWWFTGVYERAIRAVYGRGMSAQERHMLRISIGELVLRAGDVGAYELNFSGRWARHFFALAK